MSWFDVSWGYMNRFKTCVSYLEVRGVIIVAGQLGQLAHGIDPNNTFQGKVGLQGQPASKVIGGDCNLISVDSGKGSLGTHVG